jgi:hypothetical protein
VGNFWLHEFHRQVRFSSWVCCEADVVVVVVEAGVLDCDELLADEAWAPEPWS